MAECILQNVMTKNLGIYVLPTLGTFYYGAEFFIVCVLYALRARYYSSGEYMERSFNGDDASPYYCGRRIRWSSFNPVEGFLTKQSMIYLVVFAVLDCSSWCVGLIPYYYLSNSVSVAVCIVGLPIVILYERYIQSFVNKKTKMGLLLWVGLTIVSISGFMAVIPRIPTGAWGLEWDFGYFADALILTCFLLVVGCQIVRGISQLVAEKFFDISEDFDVLRFMVICSGIQVLVSHFYVLQATANVFPDSILARNVGDYYSQSWYSLFKGSNYSMSYDNVTTVVSNLTVYWNATYSLNYEFPSAEPYFLILCFVKPLARYFGLSITKNASAVMSMTIGLSAVFVDYVVTMFYSSSYFYASGVVHGAFVVENLITFALLIIGCIIFTRESQGFRNLSSAEIVLRNKNAWLEFVETLIRKKRYLVTSLYSCWIYLKRVNCWLPGRTSDATVRVEGKDVIIDYMYEAGIVVKNPKNKDKEEKEDMF